MDIKTSLYFILLGTLMPLPAFAEDMMMNHTSSYPVYHMFRVETDIGTNKGKTISSWDVDGWIGTDYNKLWLKSEGENMDGTLEAAEFWGMYSHNIATFWDAQIGFRHDSKPTSTTYAVFGVNGLAPYYFETEAHGFVSEHGDVTARFKTENDFLITQKLILQPYAEVNLSAQKVAEQDIGTGVTDAQTGLQTRYEITKRIAPYIDVHYGQKFGAAKSIAENNHEDSSELVGAVGLCFMF
ncbi:MAG: copper resistance protein B [Pseudobdellovibrionaceae bacterium]